MADLERCVVAWSGLLGLPGVSVFYKEASVGSSLPAALTTFFTAIKGHFPTALSWQIPNAGDVLNDVNGDLVGVWTDTGGTTVAGGATATQNYAAGVGYRVKWVTGDITHGRRCIGSTFLTSCTTEHYDSNGTIQNGSLGTVQTAANALVAAGVLSVWARPVEGSTNPGIPDRNGASNTVLAAIVPDKVSWFRTRRV